VSFLVDCVAALDEYRGSRRREWVTDCLTSDDGDVAAFGSVTKSA
jgi:hypothetical protein